MENKKFNTGLMDNLNWANSRQNMEYSVMQSMGKAIQAQNERSKMQTNATNCDSMSGFLPNLCWIKVEHFHEDCYIKADEPFGPAED